MVHKDFLHSQDLMDQEVLCQGLYQDLVQHQKKPDLMIRFHVQGSKYHHDHVKVEDEKRLNKSID